MHFPVDTREVEVRRVGAEGQGLDFGGHQSPDSRQQGGQEGHALDHEGTIPIRSGASSRAEARLGFRRGVRDGLSLLRAGHAAGP